MTNFTERSTPTFSDRRFGDLELHQCVRDGLAAAGFDQCTPIQALCLPLALAGKDVAGQAQTGTGKTGAFLVAALHILLTQKPPFPEDQQNPRCLIVAPTRELAIQIHQEAELFGGHSGLRIALAYGGVDYDKQRKRLAAGVDILIGTPGRIIDFFKQKIFHLKNIQVAVLDEADRMFDLGFIKDIRFLLRRMPPPQERLNMLFSATLSYRVTELAYEHMNNPERVEVVAEQVTADRVTQCVYFPSNKEKIPLLIGLLKTMDTHRTMVFCNTKAAVERVAAYLEANQFNTAVLSGDVPQKKRQSLLRRFQEGEIHILVATDIAARGLHIPEVSHVFNYDLPQDAEDYVHRIGRTARLGSSGDAISFACEDSAFSLPDIESYIESRIPVQPVGADLLAEVNTPARRPRRGKTQSKGGGSRRTGEQGAGRRRGKKVNRQGGRRSSGQS